MARLIFKSDDGKDMELQLGPNCPTVIVGRHKSCGIRTNNSTVSRRHAQVNYVDGAYQLVDMGSSNGSFFQGQRVSEHWLQHGDVFNCGAFKLRFELEDHESVSSAAAEFLDSDVLEDIDEGGLIIEATPEESGNSEAIPDEEAS